MKCSMCTHTHTRMHAVRFHSIDISVTDQHQCQKHTQTHNLYRLCFPALRKEKSCYKLGACLRAAAESSTWTVCELFN